MRPPRPISVRGFSMVELMVAMLIGLIGMIVIFQVFEVSEGIKRTTTSGGDAQQNGVIALSVIGRDLRNAGMGFNDAPYAGCNILAYDSKRAAPDFTMTLSPVAIAAGALPKDPDGLTIFYGSHPQVSSAAMLTGGDMLASTDPLPVTNAYGYRPGDLLVLLEPASVKNCSFVEVNSVASNVIRHDAGVSYTFASVNRTVRFNKPAPGLGVLYKGGKVTRVFNLGSLHEPSSLPVHNTYTITNNALAATSALALDAAGAPQPNTVADNIVHMRVLYGLDDSKNTPGIDVTFSPHLVCDGIVDRFVDGATFNAIVAAPVCPTTPPGPWQTKWQSVVAVRIALVARSALPEKPRGSDGTKCDATTEPPGPDLRPKWSGGVFDVSASGDPLPESPLHWKCYRYRVFETTVPLRNWIWRAS